MPSDLESTIRFLEEANDPETAFFTYTVDCTGEYGLIKANKEGLRLYAAELLKKSQQLESEETAGPASEQPLHFAPLQWMFSETGYDLISGVLPQFRPRHEILAGQMPPRRASSPRRQKQPVMIFILMCITGALIMLATLKA